MLNKLYLKDQEGKAPAGQGEVPEAPKRNPNFFDRKRFVDYEQNEDSEKSKEQLHSKEEPKQGSLEMEAQPAIMEEEEEVAFTKKRDKREAVRSAAPAQKKKEEKPKEEWIPEVKKEEKPAPRQEKIEDEYYDEESDRNEVKREEKSGKKSEDDNWNMSDNDFADNSDTKKPLNNQVKENVLNFDEIPTLKDSAVKEEQADNKKQIDFFGSNLDHKNGNEMLDGNEFDNL